MKKQIKVTGRIQENSVGSNIITFRLRLGPLVMPCVVNVPDEGQTEAPVYVKFVVDGVEEDRNETPQIRARGRLKENSQGGEIITFNIHLESFRIVCIVNIPEEGKDSAPVYVIPSVQTISEAEERKRKKSTEVSVEVPAEEKVA